MGNFRQGVDHFDPATGIFTHYRHDPEDPLSLSNNLTFDVAEDDERILWVATPTGLNRLVT